MPKRMIDGDALWVSEKLFTVPEKFRVEYAWLLPLAQVNGAFECSPMLVWRTCYSALRPEFNIDSVAAMLDAFEEAKMLFRFKVGTKTYGFFPGAHKEGRLPSQAERAKYRVPWNSGMVPAKELAQFLGVSQAEVSKMYRGLLLEVSKKSRRTSLIGNGNGLSNGCAEVMDGGNAAVLHTGNDGNTEAATLPSTATHSSNTRSAITPPLNNTNTATPNTFSFEDDDELDELEPRSWSDELSYTPKGFAELFRLLMHDNPNASAPPKGWQEMWEKDFKQLLGSGLTDKQVVDVIAVSQLDKNKPFYVRPATLIKKLALLSDMVREKAKAMPVIRREFQATVRRLESKY